MYFCHVFCIRRELFEEVGGFRAGFEGCQDYDLALRLTERASRITHVPKVLYHWRALPQLDRLLGRGQTRGVRPRTASGPGSARPAGDRGPGVAPGLCRRRTTWDCFRSISRTRGPRSPSSSRRRTELDRLRTCIQSILEKTTYRNYEVVVVGDDNDDPATLEYLDRLPPRCRTIRMPGTPGRRNDARVSNQAVERLDAEYILFLNSDTEVVRPEWLSQMVGYGQFPGVGRRGGAVALSRRAGEARGRDHGPLRGHAQVRLHSHAGVRRRLPVLRAGRAKLHAP